MPSRFVAATGVLLTLSVGAPAYAQNLDEITREVVDIEGDSGRLMEQPLRRSQTRSPTFVVERLTDGELFYRLQDYVRASIIFTDIVENYPNHESFPDALFFLGDSLYRAGDYLGARTRFRQLIAHSGDRRYQDHLQRALGRLIEIAIHTRDFDGVEDYFAALSRIPPSEIEATTNYYRAKYLYNRAVPTEDVLRGDGSARIDLATLEQARQAFEAVQQGSPYYSQARYFIGVIHTLREEYPQAIEAFRRVLR
ncbi:MAG: tetratricopeptide repeat protein, partial [Sandaracinaceae bacterium]